jgi:hypothetical protein
MSVGRIVALGALLVLAAACGRKASVIPMMDGRPTLTGGDMHRRGKDEQKPDSRSFRFLCSRCGQPAAPTGGICQNGNCQAALSVAASYACPNCAVPGGASTGACPACAAFGQQNGRCYYCNGSGWTGQGARCPNCRGNGRCPACAGENKCDVCGGSGTVTLDRLQNFRGRGAQAGPAPEGAANP